MVPNGVIFMCNHSTFDECVRRNLFGAKESRTTDQMAVKVQVDATRVFLYNFSTKSFFGPFRAAGRPQLHIEPSAWTASARGANTTPFPLQLRVRLEGPAMYETPEAEVREMLHYRPPDRPGGPRHFDTFLEGCRARDLGDYMLRQGRVTGGGPRPDENARSREMVHLDAPHPSQRFGENFAGADRRGNGGGGYRGGGGGDWHDGGGGPWRRSEAPPPSAVRGRDWRENRSWPHAPGRALVPASRGYGDWGV